MVDSEHKTLQLNYSGRIIDQLGIQMYQSPVAAVAELVANAWDADAETVKISLPNTLDDAAEITLEDDGIGMTFEECEERYLNVGYCRRGENPTERSAKKDRPILGRKGIGKFAGFGIARCINIQTVSENTGERTEFELDLDQLRAGAYVTQGQEISVLAYEEPTEARIADHGTRITLKSLKLGRRPSGNVFRRSMARRFTLHERAADFQILVDNRPLPKGDEQASVQFVFPADYRTEEKPEDLQVDAEGWGIESLHNGYEIKWKILFYKKPIDEEELRGISIFSHGKLAQTPFFFNLTGGLGGQHGQEYITGRVEADFLDEQQDDLIAPERQRIDFKRESTLALREWGANRLKELFRIWRDRRGEERIKALEERMSPFSERLEALPKSERKIIKKAVTNLAKISALEESEFIDLGNSLLTSWEGGRLKELISELSDTENLDDNKFIHVLLETGVLTALNIAEAVKTKIEAIRALREYVRNRTPENPLRDFIAENPWLIAEKWETFRKERSVRKLLADCAANVGFSDAIYAGRIDLALASGNHLLVLEFMKPGQPLDFDHLNRFDMYIWQIREKIETNTASAFTNVTGYLIADSLDQKTGLRRKVQEMEKSDMFAADWDTLLGLAEAAYREYLDILKLRAPEDRRLQALET